MPLSLKPSELIGLVSHVFMYVILNDAEIWAKEGRTAVRCSLRTVRPLYLMNNRKGAAMKIHEHALDDGVVWRLCGRLTGEAGDLLERAVSRATLRGRRRIVMDLSGVAMIDAGGLGALVTVYRASAASFIALSLARVPARARHLLTITHLTDVVAIFDSVEQAFQNDCSCAGISRPESPRLRELAESVLSAP